MRQRFGLPLDLHRSKRISAVVTLVTYTTWVRVFTRGITNGSGTVRAAHSSVRGSAQSVAFEGVKLLPE